MAHCSNCGGEVRFSIDSQDLECVNCKTHFDPATYNRTPESLEQEVYKTKVFTCPNCGAEIESSDLSVTGFCAYCGSAVVFNSRIKEAEKPQKIIPFQISKEKCKDLYLQKIRSFYYRQKDLEDPAYLDRFVGFYLPYWLYSYEFNGDFSLKGNRNYTSGNYAIHEDYNLSGNLQGDVKGIPFDASLRFDDDIAGVIAPFSKEKMKDFSPNYLLGFYSEIADTESKTYEKEAFSMLGEEMERTILGPNGFNRPDIKVQGKFDASCLHHEMTVDRGMFPIWFLSYKKNNRISYAIVNGETGKVYCDIPIDEKKFHKSSLLIAIPIFLVLNLLFQISAETLPIITLVLSAFLIFLSQVQLHKIRVRDREALRYSRNKRQEEAKNTEQSGTFRALLALIISVLILLWHPVRDEYYYIAAVLSAVASIFSLRRMIKKFNLLSTRSIPDFFEKKEE